MIFLYRMNPTDMIQTDMNTFFFRVGRVLLFISMLLLGSCSKNANEKQSVLRISLSAEPDSFFPWESAAADTAAICYNIFDGLFSFDEKGALQPALCVSYDISADNLVYTFHLRDGVRFHNGADFSSADCVYTYENLAGLNGNAVRADKMRVIKSVSAPDPLTFVVELKNCAGGFLYLNTSPILPVGYDNHAVLPVGTGPYKFVEYQLHHKVVLEKNDSYWNSDCMPTIPRVEIFIISDENAALSALQSNELDVAQLISANNARALEGTFQVVSNPQNMVQILGMNNTYGPLADVRVRRAISMAVNKQEIIDGVMDGFGTELYSNFSPIMGEFYNDELKGIYPYNPEAARALLAEAGYPDGFALVITVPGNYKPHVDTAEIIANQLRNVGIDCSIQSVEWTTWLDQVYTRFEYQATVIGFGGKLDPAEVLRRYYSSYKRNFTRFSDPEFDAAFDRAETETNQEKRVAYYKACQKILTDGAPAVFIQDPNNTVVMRKTVRGFTAYPVKFMNFAKMYFE